MFNLLRKTYRIWWQKPRSTNEFHIRKEVSFLELFYDLVYVVLIAEVAHLLGKNLSLEGFLQYIFVFLFVIWTWLNGVLYHNLHGQNDISTRVFTFIQMILVAGMTVFVSQIFGEGDRGFAIIFGLFHIFFSVLWFRSGRHDEQHAPAAYPFAAFYLTSGLIMIQSGFIDSDIKYITWFVTIVLSVLLPFISFLRQKTREIAKNSIKLDETAIERFGLLAIISLGEVIISSVQGVTNSGEFTFRIFAIGILGLLIAISIWWLYFDFISRRKLKNDSFIVNVGYIYLHIPMFMAISGAGGVFREMILHNGESLESVTRWIFVSLVALTIVLIGILLQFISSENQALESYSDKATITLVIFGILIFLLGFTSLGYIGLLSAILGLLLIPLFWGVGTWIRLMAIERGIEI